MNIRHTQGPTYHRTFRFDEATTFPLATAWKSIWYTGNRCAILSTTARRTNDDIVPKNKQKLLNSIISYVGGDPICFDDCHRLLPYQACESICVVLYCAVRWQLIIGVVRISFRAHFCSFLSFSVLPQFWPFVQLEWGKTETPIFDFCFLFIFFFLALFSFGSLLAL